MYSVQYIVLRQVIYLRESVELNKLTVPKAVDIDIVNKYNFR